jgi:predicted nucleic acid-binding protein
VTWLLDTNTIIYAQYTGGRVRERLDDASKRGRIVTSILVLAELFYGAERSSRPEANRAKVEQLAQAVEVLPITIGSAARFGILKQQLVSRGRVKADVDLHIAATAIEVGATLVTNDGALLAGDIEGLVAENWI